MAVFHRYRRKQSLEELSQNLLICPPSEMVDRLAVYEEAGIDELILSSGMGQSQEEMLEGMQRFSEEIMPHLALAEDGTNKKPSVVA